MTARRLHRANALALAGFLALHLTNHAALLAGRDAHTALLHALRPFYRHPVVEPALLALFVSQALLGLWLARARGRPLGGWAWAQVGSGLLLALFLVQHLPAVLVGRLTRDTDTQFAAAVVEAWPAALYFAPYYVVAVTALATHLACAVRFARYPRPPGPLAWGLPLGGLVFGVAIVAGLRGGFG